MTESQDDDASEAGTHVPDDVAWQRLSPAVRVAWLVQALFVAGMAIALAAFVDYAALGADAAWPWPRGTLFAGVGVIALLLAWWVPQAAYRHWRFALGPRAVMLEHGLVRRVCATLPRSRLRRVDIVAGPIARRLGLASVRLVTDERATDDPVLPGLVVRRAEAVRDELLRLGPSRGVTAGARGRARGVCVVDDTNAAGETQQWLDFEREQRVRA